MAIDTEREPSSTYFLVSTSFVLNTWFEHEHGRPECSLQSSQRKEQGIYTLFFAISLTFNARRCVETIDDRGCANRMAAPFCSIRLTDIHRLRRPPLPKHVFCWLWGVRCGFVS